MSKEQKRTEDELRAKLSDEEYRITQNAGTEPAFSGEYWAHKAPGLYRCVCCGAELFSSAEKYDSGTGWPSFSAPAAETAVSTTRDTSHAMVREEVECAKCAAHLGHVFPDGPQPSGLRYCMNSASLTFDPEKEV